MSLILLSAAMLTITGQQQATVDPRLMRFPSIHGDTVVFTYAGDLWVAKTEGGLARRLTSSPGLETRARISPDGQWVAFTGQYEGNSDVFAIPIEGGEPKRLTYEPETDNVVGWTPDGKIAYVSAAGSFTNRQQRLWYVDPRGGLPIRTPIIEAAEASFFPGGDQIAYNRTNSYNFNWRRYRGGTQGRISIYNFRTNLYSELAQGREQSYFPMVAKNAVYFISDRNQGTLNLYKYELGSKKTTQLTNYTDEDIKFPSTDGQSIVFERDGYLFTYDLDNGAIKKLTPKIASENLSARPYLRSLGNQISSFSISPTGTRVAVEARGELFSVPKQGDTRNITNTSGARERHPNWSPDGHTIAYISDATGNYEVYTQPQLGGTATQLTTNSGLSMNGLTYSPDSKKLLITTEANELWMVDIATKKLTKLLKAEYGFGGAEFSPDSRYVALINSGPNLMGVVTIIDTTDGSVHKVNEGHYSDTGVTWDLSGKYLYFTSARSFNPTYGQYEFSLKVQDAERVYVLPLTKDLGNPLTVPNEEEPEQIAPAATRPAPPSATAPSAPGVRIDWDGISDRALPLPMGPGNYGAMIGAGNGVFYATGGTLFRFDLQSRDSTPIMAGFLGAFDMNPTRTKMAYAGLGGVLGIVDVRPGLTPGAGRVDTSGIQAVINPRDEWKQIFWEAWRFTRDNYYDPNYRGLNWRSVGEHYAQYLPFVNHRSDLSYVLGLMIGELGTGHSYVQGGDMGPGPTPIPVGNLGVDYETFNGKVRFKKIYRGENFEESRRGPLGEPGVNVNEGDYLLAIDGKPLDATIHPDSLLLDKIGKYVTLTVNSTPNVEGARKIRVRPIASEANLRYISWAEENRRYVDKMSGGRIGYMHIPNTATEGAVELIRGYYSQTDKDAVVVDERWNGGGFIQPWFVDTLGRKMRAGIQNRNASDTGDAVAIEGPKALLINGYAGSGGDFFPWMFRQSKLGPLIGTRTWGGLIGISGGAPLVDGGSITAPEFAIYDRTTGEIIAENTGISPDIEVDARPDLVAKGEDPQLDAAIKYLQEELKKMPPKKKRATIPVVGKEGRVNGK
ncbi:S41 family peptidase [Fimbriimonas ginsengisoli]|uniref:Tricorn protease homolog n=1 Tax=Fimbriimonas ginsengisoli Gsoil 348 TaxID=661478 RepID=A0A068NNQ8_FIMGI|nr:S41 family peptidase [Fimbriimonas ginsengisoli]AIE85051.1 putative exported protease [Fimbriimonas ginsengisoli Gsoil 348]